MMESDNDTPVKGIFTTHVHLKSYGDIGFFFWGGVLGGQKYLV